MKNAIYIIAFIFLLSGCSIKQELNPLQETINTNICIIEDEKVREGFLITFQRTLKELGYQVTMLPAGSGFTECEVVSTYMGRWSWDLAIYLSYATIQVYRNGTLIGDILYDSRSGVGNLSKFVDGEEKIEELVKALFTAVQ